MSDAPRRSFGRISLTKGTDAPASAPRPRQVQLAAGALVLSGLSAFIGAIALYGERSWLTSQQRSANATSVSKAVVSATSHAAKVSSDPASASAAASASATKKYPLGGSKLHDSVTQQQSGTLIGTIIVMAAVSFLAFGVYRGRHWSRWGVTIFWLLASFTGTTVGLSYLLGVGSHLPAAFKVPSFIAALALVVAVALVNLRPSTEYFALSRPAPRPGAPARRGLFGPRPPVNRAPARTNPPATPENAAAEKAAERQRAKKRAVAEAQAHGRDLARARAKASKSRRVDKGAR